MASPVLADSCSGKSWDLGIRFRIRRLGALFANGLIARDVSCQR